MLDSLLSVLRNPSFFDVKTQPLADMEPFYFQTHSDQSDLSRSIYIWTENGNFGDYARQTHSVAVDASDYGPGEMIHYSPLATS